MVTPKITATVLTCCAITIAHATPAGLADTCGTDKTNAGISLYDNFSNATVDSCKWELVRANWGGELEGRDYNGGVVPENIGLKNGILSLAAHGNHYEGNVAGVDSKGRRRADGRRVGAAIRSQPEFLGGRFEACVKIAGKPGVASALWTFHYDKPDDGDARNHEIDIEFPGQAGEDAPPRFDYVTLTTWTGLKTGQSTATFRALGRSLADDCFHLLRFDWSPPTDNDPGSVTFFIDGKRLASSRSNIPNLAGRLWLGAWFPPRWAGEPDFAEAEMLVDWVRVTPLETGLRKDRGIHSFLDLSSREIASDRCSLE